MYFCTYIVQKIVYRKNPLLIVKKHQTIKNRNGKKMAESQTNQNGASMESRKVRQMLKIVAKLLNATDKINANKCTLRNAKHYICNIPDLLGFYDRTLSNNSRGFLRFYIFSTTDILRPIPIII